MSKPFSPLDLLFDFDFELTACFFGLASVQGILLYRVVKVYFSACSEGESLIVLAFLALRSWRPWTSIATSAFSRDLLFGVLRETLACRFGVDLLARGIRLAEASVWLLSDKKMLVLLINLKMASWARTGNPGMHVAYRLQWKKQEKGFSWPVF